MGIRAFRNSGGIEVIDRDVVTDAQGLGQQFAMKLIAGQGGTLLCISDSTGDGAGEWPDLLARKYAEANPLVTVNATTWTDGQSSYPATSQIQAGDGSHGTLTVYNCSVASKEPHYFLAPYFDAMIAAVQPDLAIVSLGHNQNSAAAVPFWRDDLLALMESISLACPLAELVLATQNPRTDATAAQQASRRIITAQVATLRGWGLIDTYRQFLDPNGSVLTGLINVDGIHPNPTGEAAMLLELWARLSFKPGLVAHVARPESSLLDPRITPLLNADFASFASPPTLPNWTATNATLSKNTSQYEGPNGYSVKMVAASAALAYIEQTITGDALKPYLGRVVTFAARVYVPAGQNANVGRIHIRTSTGSNTISLNSFGTSQGQGGWRWQSISGRVDASAGSLICRVYCENGTTGTGEVSVDRTCLAPGLLPRDVR